MARTRIDKMLVDMGLSPSRERARALIMAGKVLVNDEPVTKAGTLVKDDSNVRLRGEDHSFVSRGGLKLNGALEDLGVDVSEKTILDIGASTGGFTDVCLRRGAVKVYAIDVGTNQLAYSLRTDSRVLCLEQTNARHLTPDMLPGLGDIAVIDVSFISITKILPALVDCLVEDAHIVAMVKPQFEVGREKVGKGGVVRDDALRQEAADNVIACGKEFGFELAGQADSHIAGPKGNREIFIHLVRGSKNDQS